MHFRNCCTLQRREDEQRLCVLKRCLHGTEHWCRVVQNDENIRFSDLELCLKNCRSCDSSSKIHHKNCLNYSFSFRSYWKEMYRMMRSIRWAQQSLDSFIDGGRPISAPNRIESDSRKGDFPVSISLQLLSYITSWWGDGDRYMHWGSHSPSASLQRLPCCPIWFPWRICLGRMIFVHTIQIMQLQTRTTGIYYNRRCWIWD